MSPPIIGYFIWRRNMRSGVTCEKILKSNVDHWQTTNKARYNEHMASLIASHPLNDVEWGFSLRQLTASYPPAKESINVE